MAFYDLSFEERQKLVKNIEEEVRVSLAKTTVEGIVKYASSPDTYIRKTTYLALGRIYKSSPSLHGVIIKVLTELFANKDEKVRQTSINALGEIGKINAEIVLPVLKKGMFDNHHIVRNAVIGTLKKMGEVNPKPTITFASKFIHNPNPQVRRQAIHGIELRGRTHPEEVLPLLRNIQNEQNRMVRNMIIHVLGQISYKEGCLEKVIAEIKNWENKELVQKVIAEIIETHEAYQKFSAKSISEAKKYIEGNI